MVCPYPSFKRSYPKLIVNTSIRREKYFSNFNKTYFDFTSLSANSGLNGGVGLRRVKSHLPFLRGGLGAELIWEISVVGECEADSDLFVNSAGT